MNRLFLMLMLSLALVGSASHLSADKEDLKAAEAASGQKGAVDDLQSDGLLEDDTFDQDLLDAEKKAAK